MDWKRSDESHGLWYREGSEDLKIIDECLRRDVYGKTEPQPDELVLDIGGNIGASAEAFVRRGCKVVSFEPEPENCALWKANMQGKRAVLCEAAVTNFAGPVTLYVSNRKNQATHSLYKKEGYTELEVPGHAFGQLMVHYQPDIVKCDIEGGEYLLTWGGLPARTRAVVVELHTQKREWREEGLYEYVVKALENQGFTPLYRPAMTTGWPKVWTFRRDV